MKNVLLKIIIVIAFVGIFVVGGILIIKNRNVDLMAYNTIKIKSEEIKIDELSKNALKVKDSYDGALDIYANTVYAMIYNTNLGIDFYLDYLVNIRTISRGEQDMLIEKYLAYGDAVKKAEEAYILYDKTYKEADVGENIRKNITANAGTFVTTYLDVYKANSEFYKSLVEIINKYSHNGHRDYNFIEFRLHMINALSDNCVSVIEENMQKRINTGSNTGLVDIQNAQCFTDYRDFAIKANEYEVSKTYMTIEFDGFLIKCRELDIVKLITEKSDYVKTLSEEQNVIAADVLAFINSKFGIAV